MRNCKATSVYLAGAVSLALFLTAASAGASSARSLSRSEDFVVLSGQETNALLGEQIMDLRLYSCDEGVCGEVPVQIDKVDAIGRYVFAQDANSERDGSVLDENDEISLMASDAGDRQPPDFSPDGASAGVEIELVDPLDGGVAWAYLYAVPGSPRPELADYVGYRIDGEYTILESPRFVMGYKTGGMYYDLMRARTPSGELGPDVLDRQRLGIEGLSAGDFVVPINVPESLVKTRDIAVIDGPIRVIVDEIVMVNLGEFSFQYGTEYFYKVYRCGQHNSVTYEFPTALENLFKSMSMHWSLDFTDEVKGSNYLDPHHLDATPIGDEACNTIPDDEVHYWWGMWGESGSVLHALQFDDDMLSRFACSGRWRQDPNPRKKEGEHPGRLELGFECSETTPIPGRADYKNYNYILFPETPSKEGLLALKDVFEHPLQVKVSDLPKNKSLSVDPNALLTQ